MSAQEEIMALENELRQAQLSSDAVVLERLIDDALVFTAIDGKVASKQDDLDLHRSGHFKVTRMEPREWHVLPLQGLVIVNVLMDAQASIAGELKSGLLRYTRVWYQRPEGWRVVAGHVSEVS